MIHGRKLLVLEGSLGSPGRRLSAVKATPLGWEKPRSNASETPERRPPAVKTEPLGRKLEQAGGRCIASKLTPKLRHRARQPKNWPTSASPHRSKRTQTLYVAPGSRGPYDAHCASRLGADPGPEPGQSNLGAKWGQAEPTGT